MPSEPRVETVKHRPFALSPLPEGQFRLVVTEGPDAGAEFWIDGSQPSRTLIGTSESCVVRLSDPTVSRRHLAVELVGSQLRISDLGSTNGTFIDHVAVVEGFISGGTQLRLGATTFRVEHDAREAKVVLSTKSMFGRLVGSSREMRRIYPVCERLAASDVPLVVEGETGTGKEVLAEAIHEQGLRAAGPFIVFDCTAVPASLLESELFGHEKGAFTGAISSRQGVFEAAHKGTLFIDEIGDLELAMQAKLLRALERSEVHRVGGNKWVRVDVRIIAATRRDLDREVQEGRFRDDLFHRLVVTRIELPPLRRRYGDIPILARHFCKALGGKDDDLSHELLARWEGASWPGNVRELRNAVARQIALGDMAGSDIRGTPVGAATKSGVDDEIAKILTQDLPLVRARELVVHHFEQRYVERILVQHGGSVRKAAEASGIALRHFQRLRARGK